jgi:hypothetical protein
MAKLVQVTDVEEAITYWENGMLMCRDGERKWGDYSGWREDDVLRTVVRTCLDNEMGGWILVEDDGEDGSQIACGEDASPTTVSED